LFPEKEILLVNNDLLAGDWTALSKCLVITGRGRVTLFMEASSNILFISSKYCTVQSRKCPSSNHVIDSKYLTSTSNSDSLLSASVLAVLISLSEVQH